MEQRYTSQPRRKVLKVVGASAVGVTGLSTESRAANGVDFVGLAYNPTTHEIIGGSTGKFSEAGEQLHGTLRIRGEEYSFEKDEPWVKNDFKGREQNQFLKKVENKDKPNKQKKAENDDQSNKAKKRVKVLTGKNRGLTGYVNPPGSERIAFSLTDPRKSSRKDIRDLIKKTAPNEEEDQNE